LNLYEQYRIAPRAVTHVSRPCAKSAPQEAAVNGRASATVTHNVRDFLPAARLRDRSDYTERCAPEDEEMSKNTYPLKLPTSVKKAAAELAASDGVSLNQFIAAVVAEKVGSLRAADDFLRERAGTAKAKDMLKYLRRAPKVVPSADDTQ
jgi:predicted HicB family RNase H-like nuclease